MRHIGAGTDERKRFVKDAELAERVSLRCGDLTSSRWNDATHVFCCSVLFPQPVMQTLEEALLDGISRVRVFCTFKVPAPGSDPAGVTGRRAPWSDL